MSYKVLCDNEILCSSSAEDTALIDPVVSLKVNKAGSFKFTMSPSHPYYSKVSLRQSIIDVYQNGELIFEGIPVTEKTDFWKQKTITCEGELTFLNDSILRQAAFKNKTVTQLLGEYLSRHNNQVNNYKQFQVGTVTVSGTAAIRYINYQTTMAEINEDLIKDFGGYLRVRHDQGVRYLDYLAASPHTSTQVIRLGKNLLNLKTNLDTLDVCTVLIPLGTKTGAKVNNTLDKRLTVNSVNNNKDYIVGTGSNYYGYIWRTKTWDDITVASNLLTAGQNYLNDTQWANLTITATALDLGLLESDVEQFRLLDQIRVVSDAHGIDRYFMLTELEIDLNHPGNTKITLGQDYSATLSAQVAEASTEIENTPTQINIEAAEQARQILESATGGNIYFVYDANGVCTEIRIMDTNDPNTATKIWRWNINGWGYSGDGGQTYNIAATMNGAIVADFITAGTLNGININGTHIYGSSDMSIGEVKDLDGSDYSQTDLDRIIAIIMGATPTVTDLARLDVNQDGVINVVDYGYIRDAINNGSASIDLTVTIDATTTSDQFIKVGESKIGVQNIYSPTLSGNSASVSSLSVSSNATVGGTLTLAGHSSPVGTILSAKPDNDMLVSTSSTAIVQLELPPGVWYIAAYVRFTSVNSAGNRMLNISATSSATDARIMTECPIITGKTQQLECSGYLDVSSITTYNLNALSSVACSANKTYSQITAVRIA